MLHKLEYCQDQTIRTFFILALPSLSQHLFSSSRQHPHPTVCSFGFALFLLTVCSFIFRLSSFIANLQFFTSNLLVFIFTL